MFHVEHARRKIRQKCFTWNVVTSLTIFNKEISKNISKTFVRFKNNHYLCIVKFNNSNMNKIKSTHYLLVTDVIYNDGENAQRYNSLLWWNVNHCNVTLKLRTVIKNGKPTPIMTLLTPEDRTDLVDEFDELVSKVNGLYPVYDLISVCGGLSIRDDEEDKAHRTQHYAAAVCQSGTTK